MIKLSYKPDSVCTFLAHDNHLSGIAVADYLKRATFDQVWFSKLALLLLQMGFTTQPTHVGASHVALIRKFLINQYTKTLFTFLECFAFNSIVSVALSVSLRLVAVSHHHFFRSPDFPLYPF